MLSNAFLPAGEKYLKNKVDLMSWSSTKDLLALTSKSGELFLYRFVSLERVWVLPAPEDGVKITSIKWRPDGKVIGVVYNTKKYGIQFVYMEKAKIIWKLKSKYNFETILMWEKLKDSVSPVPKPTTKLNETAILDDEFNTFTIKDYIPELPKLTTENDLSGQDLQTITGECGFHVMLVSSDQRIITWLAYGIYPIMQMDCLTIDPNCETASLINACVSPCFRYLSVITKSNTTHAMHTYKLDKMADNISIFDNMAKKVVHLQFSMVYLEEVLDCMRESCETVLQETGSKLTNLLKKNCDSTSIGDDFMQLLMWGKLTPTLKDLFGNRMNKKTIVKIGATTEAVYLKLQQYIIVNVQVAVNTLYYHLSEIKGVINDETESRILPVNEKIVIETMKCAGSFMLKANEMLQVIERSLQTFKTFFRWLYISMLRYLDEPIASIPKMSQMDFSFVADFIYEHFFDDNENDISSTQESHFNVERVFQYLTNEPLTCMMDSSGNDWHKFIDSTPCLKACDWILPREPKASLRQLCTRLHSNISDLCFADEFPIVSSCEQISSTIICECIVRPICNVWYQTVANEESDAVSQSKERFCATISDDELSDSIVFVFTCLEKNHTNNKYLTKFALLNFSSLDGDEGSQRKVMELKHYNDKYIAVLLNEQKKEQHTTTSWLALVFTSTLLKLVEEGGVDCSESDDYLSRVRPLDAFTCVSHRRVMEERLKPTNISASGTREIACVLSEDHHHISAYEMDQSEEEESENSEEVDEME